VIDNRTEHKNYPLPHPENIASQDVGRIAEAIEMVDSDVNACSTVIDGIVETVQELDAKALRIPSSLVGTVNTELSDLEPRRYIVVNDDATGFSTVEGGGGEGGLMGEVLAKRSKFNFDTMWIDPRAVLKKSSVVNEVDADCVLKNNNVVILADDIEIDNSDQLPRVGLTQRQVLSDVIADSQYTYILCDEIDESAPDESDIATREKFGRVMIGDGINDDNGKISVPTPVKASKTEFGIVKIGPGLDVKDGVASAPSYQHADHENFGTVKLSNDFKKGNDGELLLANKKNVEEIVYQAANVDIVRNNCIIPKSTFAKYRLFLNEDSLIIFDWSQIIIEKDLGFDLEIISDGIYVISFNAQIIWTLPCAGVSAGKTIIHFERKFGSTILYASMIDCEYQNVADLMVNDLDDIQKDLVCGTNGCVDNLSYVFTVRSNVWHDGGYTGNSSEQVILYVDFMRSTFVDHLSLWKGFYSGTTSQFFVVEASVDGKNWAILLKTDPGAQVLENTLYLNKKGHFRHYRLRFAKDITVRGFKFYGFYIDDELFELQKIMPLMTANSLDEFSITSSGTNDGALFNLTSNSISNFANFSARDGDGKYWIKYELPEAKIVNFIDIASHKDAADRFPSWFKIEASNDDENWTLLLERAALTYWNGGTTKQYYLQNNTAYKFYKFTPIELTSTEFRIARFRLYRKIAGQEILRKFIPILSSPLQGGYEVSCSSEISGHLAYYVFDGDDGSQWATTAGNAQNSFIQIKFPTETICNAVSLKARNDQYYVQSATSFEIQGSNDGSVFSTLKSVNTSWIQGEEKVVSFFNDIAFLYYRIFVKTVQNNGDHAAFSSINFGTAQREYKRELNSYRTLTPVMSANSQDGFVLTANSIYTGQKVYNPFEAFNRTVSDSSSWTTKTQSGWIQVELPEADVANMLQMSGGFSNEEPDSFVLSGSNDGVSYTELLDSGALTWTHNETKTWEFENELAYKFYKIDAVNTKSAYITISEIKLIQHQMIKEY
jgi:hypothetical protein